MGSSRWTPTGRPRAGATDFKRRKCTLQLSDLPAELFREVLYSLDPSSFCICLQTSRLFRQHALSSTDLLVTQILRIPGPWNESLLRKSSTKRLLALFQKDAAKHLKHGPWMTDMHIWKTLSDVDSRNSSVMQLKWVFVRAKVSRQMQAFVQVQRFCATIHIYYIEHHGSRGSSPRLKHIISPESVSKYLPVGGEDSVQYRVLKVATWVPSGDPTFATPGPLLAVLYGGRLSPVGREMKILLIFRLDENFGPILVDHCEPKSGKDERVVAMAVSTKSEVVLLYQREGLWDCGYRLAVLTRDVIEKGKLDRSWTEQSTTLAETPIPLGGIITQGRVAHICSTSFPLPQWTISGLAPLEDIRLRDTLLPGDIEPFQKTPYGRVIAHHHHHKIVEESLEDGVPNCVNTALELAISRDGPRGRECHDSTRIGAYLLKVVEYPRGCRKFDTNVQYGSLEHVFVAELDGMPDLSNLSSLGLKIAVSPRSERIAIASWKTVKVWALDPLAFLDPVYSLAGDEGVPGDYAFLEGTGWRYYACGNTRRECVLLEPVELPSAGVVYDLRFSGEDELWGWCERGLVRWDFGPTARQKRVKAHLDGV